MTIEQLNSGQEVTLEVIVGESSFEIKTEVLGTNMGTGALLRPYIYNGQVVDFTKGSPRSLSFALHCIDSKTGGRVVWKAITVSLVNFKGVDYYAIDTKAFGSIAASSERREDARVDVKSQGKAILDGIGDFPITVMDISDAGVSFICRDTRATIGDQVLVEFDDVAHGSPFSLGINIRLVRVEAKGDDVLYAGKILDGDKKLLAYLCFKGMDAKVNG